MLHIFIEYQLVKSKCPNVASHYKKNIFLIYLFYNIYKVTRDNATCPTR